MLLKMPLFHSVFMLSSIPLHVCIYIYTCIYVYALFIHSSLNGYLGCVHVLATINSAAVNIGGGVHVSFQIILFSGCMPRDWIAGSYTPLLQFFEEPPCSSPQWLPQFTSHPQCRRASFPPHPLPHLSFTDFVMTATLSGVRWLLP